MRTVLFAGPGEKPRRIEDEGELARLVREGKGCLWVDLEKPTDDDRALLSRVFNFHALAIEQCVAQSSHPRLHDYGAYVYLVVHAVRPGAETAGEDDPRTGVRIDELDAFLGGHYLVTYHDGPLTPVEELRRRAGEVATVMERGPDRVLAELLDEIAEGTVAVVEDLSGAVEAIEDRLFKRAGKPALRRIFSLKKDLVHLRRVIGPQREVLSRLARGESTVVSKEEAIYFRDVYDHVYRVSEMLESLRDVLTSALEVYLTIISNRTNEIMKVLTVFSIILMSSSLVAGIYGMNVPLPLGESRAGFYILLALMSGVAAVPLAWFRLKKWI